MHCSSRRPRSRRAGVEAGVLDGDAGGGGQPDGQLLVGVGELGAAGLLYVPRACRLSPGCRAHIAFHGCNQQREKAGDVFARDTGYANWADANRLIVPFPQVNASAVRGYHQPTEDRAAEAGRAAASNYAVLMTAADAASPAISGR